MTTTIPRGGSSVSSDMASERSSAAVSERYPGDSEPRTDYALLPRAPAGGEHPLARTAPPPAAPPGTPLRPGMAYLHDAFEATSGNSPAARPRKVAAAAPLPSHLLFDLSRTQARLCPPAIDADAPRQRPLPPPPPPPSSRLPCAWRRCRRCSLGGGRGCRCATGARGRRARSPGPSRNAHPSFSAPRRASPPPARAPPSRFPAQPPPRTAAGETRPPPRPPPRRSPRWRAGRGGG